MFDQHFTFVWRSVRRLGVPDHAADDAAQEVFAIASRRLQAIELGKEKAFLFGTAVRVASGVRRSHGRRRDRVNDDGVVDPADELPPAGELLDRKRARQLLDEIIASLPEDTRPIFVLYELEEMTMAEIAELLELPPGTVASRLRRGREEFGRAVAARSGATQGGTR